MGILDKIFNRSERDLESQKFYESSYTGTGVDVRVEQGTTGEPTPASEKKTAPTIVHVTAVVAGDQYSYTFPDGTKHFTMQSKKICNIQYAWVTGKTKTEFIEVPFGRVRELSGLWLNTRTIYFETDKANNVVRFETWT